VNSNATGIFFPTEIGQVIQGNADAPYASNIAFLNRWKTFREIEFKEGDPLSGGKDLDLLNPNARLYGELEAIFPARDCVGFASPYEIILIVPFGGKVFTLHLALSLSMSGKSANLSERRNEFLLLPDKYSYLSRYLY